MNIPLPLSLAGAEGSRDGESRFCESIAGKTALLSISWLSGMINAQPNLFFDQVTHRDLFNNVCNSDRTRKKMTADLWTSLCITLPLGTRFAVRFCDADLFWYAIVPPGDVRTAQY